MTNTMQLQITKSMVKLHDLSPSGEKTLIFSYVNPDSIDQERYQKYVRILYKEHVKWLKEGFVFTIGQYRLGTYTKGSPLALKTSYGSVTSRPKKLPIMVEGVFEGKYSEKKSREILRDYLDTVLEMCLKNKHLYEEYHEAKRQAAEAQSREISASVAMSNFMSAISAKTNTDFMIGNYVVGHTKPFLKRKGFLYSRIESVI